MKKLLLLPHFRLVTVTSIYIFSVDFNIILIIIFIYILHIYDIYSTTLLL